MSSTVVSLLIFATFVTVGYSARHPRDTDLATMCNEHLTECIESVVAKHAGSLCQRLQGQSDCVVHQLPGCGTKEHKRAYQQAMASTMDIYGCDFKYHNISDDDGDDDDNDVGTTILPMSGRTESFTTYIERSTQAYPNLATMCREHLTECIERLIAKHAGLCQQLQGQIDCVLHQLPGCGTKEHKRAYQQALEEVMDAHGCAGTTILPMSGPKELFTTYTDRSTQVYPNLDLAPRCLENAKECEATALAWLVARQGSLCQIIQEQIDCTLHKIPSCGTDELKREIQLEIERERFEDMLGCDFNYQYHNRSDTGTASLTLVTMAAVFIRFVLY